MQPQIQMQVISQLVQQDTTDLHLYLWLHCDSVSYSPSGSS